MYIWFYIIHTHLHFREKYLEYVFEWCLGNEIVNEIKMDSFSVDNEYSAYSLCTTYTVSNYDF